MYHADPHPGNILVSAGPTITLIDFGATAEISSNMRVGLVNLLHAAIKRDTTKIIGALQQMGFIAHRADPQVYDRVVEFLYQRFHQHIHVDSFNLKDIRFDPQRGLEDLADLRKMDISISDLTSTFHVPKEWIMLERTVLMLMGLCTVLDPELNPMVVLRPHVEKFVLGEEGDWSSFMVDAGRDLILTALALPSEMSKLTERLLKGDVEIRVIDEADDAGLYYNLGQQAIYIALVIAGCFVALRCLDQGRDMWAAGCGGVGSFFALMWLRTKLLARKLLSERRRHTRQNRD